MSEECLICGAPLEYLETEVQMECAICHKKENSKTRCVRGHYVCNDCHTAGLDAIVGLCLNEASKNPVEILEKMMAMPFCHMHGPEHHVMVGAALLTAYKNAGGALDLPKALGEMLNRGKKVPGGACGFWGACGAGISSGMFISIASGSTPLSVEPFALSHKMTAKSLTAIGEIGGPAAASGIPSSPSWQPLTLRRNTWVWRWRSRRSSAPISAKTISASENAAPFLLPTPDESAHKLIGNDWWPGEKWRLENNR